MGKNKELESLNDGVDIENLTAEDLEEVSGGRGCSGCHGIYTPQSPQSDNL